MKKKIIKWLIVLLFSIAGGIAAMNYGMEVIHCILAKVIGVALILALLFAVLMIFLETHLAKHSNPFKHEIEKRKAKKELEEEMGRRFEK